MDLRRTQSGFLTRAASSKCNAISHPMFTISNVIQMDNRMRAIEFFAGLGGFSAAWPHVDVVAAFDIHQVAATVYAANFSHPFHVREIESIASSEVQALNANLWWMSPPCQPYTARGNQADIADPRARSLLHLIELIPECLPEFIVLENVLGFTASVALKRLLEQLHRNQYQTQTIQLCPTQMNWPNRRPRFYLIASRTRAITPWRELPQYTFRVSDFLEPTESLQAIASELQVDAQTIANQQSAMDRSDPIGEPHRPTACFASSYGRAALNSGSYLVLPGGGYRRFAPREIANLLGFPREFHWPAATPTRVLWKLFGNSLSLPAVRYLLSHLPEGPNPQLPLSR